MVEHLSAMSKVLFPSQVPQRQNLPQPPSLQSFCWVPSLGVKGPVCMMAWMVKSLVLGHPSSIGYRFHLMEWALNQIRHCYSRKFCATIALDHFKAKQIVGFCGWVYIYLHCFFVYISLLLVCTVLCHTKDTNVEVKAPCRYQLDFFMFS